MEKGYCPVDTFINFVKGKRKATIVLHLKQGTKRYKELSQLLPDISDRMLSKNLKELEEAGIINRKAYPTIPPKVEYSLTELGGQISPILKAMLKGGRLFEKRMEE
ncbi:HxlR family transcriptional regulator [Ancylomarina subtilis]|uniref:HxlR family transcriptional regulator n=1 Tax=Ancylomarina subtilis TaxID=1639035 RepID=A0A4Q7VCC7_9BACT|nr:helix-turn-helix domain-containing protein [Ancylomarina subtilis]RZT93507.1 HxlR family transcriptional regulator [Ancylomarina subtilis]